MHLPEIRIGYRIDGERMHARIKGGIEMRPVSRTFGHRFRE